MDKQPLLLLLTDCKFNSQRICMFLPDRSPTLRIQIWLRDAVLQRLANRPNDTVRDSKSRWVYRVTSTATAFKRLMFFYAVGMNFGIQIAWVAVSCITIPLFQFFMRGREVAAWKKSRAGGA